MMGMKALLKALLRSKVMLLLEEEEERMMASGKRQPAITTPLNNGWTALGILRVGVGGVGDDTNVWNHFLMTTSAIRYLCWS